MKKKQGIATLIIMAVLTVLLAYTVFVGWGEHHTGAMKNIKTGLDLSGGVSITYEAVEAAPSASDMDDTIYKLQQRVTQFSTESNVYQQGLNRINVEIPGVSDANQILAELGKPGALEFQDSEGTVVLQGTDIAGAEGVAYQDNKTGEHKYVVDLTLTSEGSKKFAEATEANLGKQIAIVYDGEVVSAPVVQSVITGGKAEITGMSDIESARKLASFIRIGSLSLELNEIYSNVVGASLGQNALHVSVIAGIIGILLVILFMICVYRISGLAAGWALVLFVLLDLAFMNAFDITLTLPGIAGVILTIGMAVDANVIIYARSREELSAGRGVYSALKAGFSKALSAILDGNITTLIAAVVLYALGTGSIQGFSVTLAVGVILSMFTSLVLSRLLSYAFYGVGARDEKLYGSARQNRVRNFVGKRAVPMIIALIMIIAVPVGLAARHGMNFSLDFIGGTATTVDFGEEYSLADLDEKVQPVVSEVTGDNDIQFQKIQGSTSVIIKTKELNLDKRNELNAVLEENFENVTASEITAENISSIISGEMRSHAILAVIIAVAAMLVYIFIRFRDIRFASSAVIALVHDIAVCIAFYIWFRISVGSSFIAVMLTILGYSINATIVIFDRIRENMAVMRGDSYRNIVDTSISQTLTRSLYSNLTTFITIFVLFLMSRGIPSIREFALPIIIGLIAGAFSSVFVTGPLWYIMKTKNGKADIVPVGAGQAPAAAAAPAVAAGSTVEKTAQAAAGAVNASKNKHVKKDRSELQSTKRKKSRRR
ncbi:MAG: protein translocase subunit SecD [Eubacterium sp.]|nr:protein translocase subunit SecD [Eubacterium sp.]